MSKFPSSASSLDEGLIGDMSVDMGLSGFVEGNLDAISEIGVILPTYCEAQNIESLINEIENLNLNTSILVIDDSSPDGTSDIVRKCQKEYDNLLLFERLNKSGLGTAITAGFRIFLSVRNPPKHIVTMDADYSHDPKEIPHLLSAAKIGSELVIGSRYCKGGNIKNWSPVRLVISRVANMIASLLVGAKIHDYTSGFRCYALSLVKEITNDLHSQTYEIQIETIRQAWRRLYTVTETPMSFVSRKKGKSKLTSNEIKGFLSYILRLTLEKGKNRS